MLAQMNFQEVIVKVIGTQHGYYIATEAAEAACCITKYVDQVINQGACLFMRDKRGRTRAPY